MPAEEKEKALRDWKKFIEHDFDLKYFTERLYKHISLHCEFIAHFNRHGFYDSYFANPESTIKFLHQFDRDFGCVSVEYGSTRWLSSEDYADINTAMVGALEPYKSNIYPRLKQKAKERKLAEIERLKEEIKEME
jgi:hypothetical protein